MLLFTWLPLFQLFFAIHVNGKTIVSKYVAKFDKIIVFNLLIQKFAGGRLSLVEKILYIVHKNILYCIVSSIARRKLKKKSYKCINPIKCANESS